MNARTQITLNSEMQRRAEARAAELGLSFNAYVRRLLAEDLGEPEPPRPEPTWDVSVLFDLGGSDEPTDIARDKDKMVGQAVWEEHLRDVGHSPKPSRSATKPAR